LLTARTLWFSVGMIFVGYVNYMQKCYDDLGVDATNYCNMSLGIVQQTLFDEISGRVG